MVAAYMVEVAGKPQGPLTAHQVVKLFDGGQVSKSSKVCRLVPGMPLDLSSPHARPLGESNLFAQFDQLRLVANTPPSQVLFQLVEESAAQARELQAIRRHLLWLRVSVGLMFAFVVLFGVRTVVAVKL